jgi:hypothetical protein
MLTSEYVWEELGFIGKIRVGNAGSQTTPEIFFISGVMIYICTGGVNLTLFDLSLWEGLG